jgi:hypothetical protein
MNLPQILKANFFLLLLFWVFLKFDTRSHYVVQVGLKLAV